MPVNFRPAIFQWDKVDLRCGRSIPRCGFNRFAFSQATIGEAQFGHQTGTGVEFRSVRLVKPHDEFLGGGAFFDNDVGFVCAR